MFETMKLRTPLFSKFMAVLFGLSMSASVLAAGPQQVSMKTSMGEIVVELDATAAPKTVANFLAYVKSGFYKGTIFHRVIDGFMIQGGGFDGKLKQKATRPPVVNEAQNGLKNAPYTIAMARTANPNSATAQFFINVAENASLDYPGQDGFGYTVFGKVVSGMEVIQKIKTTPTGAGGPFPSDVPKTPSLINSATLVK